MDTDTVVSAPAGDNFKRVLSLGDLVVFGIAITAVNLRGIQMTSRANYVMNAIMGASLVWFILLAIRALWVGVGEGAFFSAKPFFNPQTFSFGEVIGATSLAVLSFIGFDGVTTLAEDAKDPSCWWWPDWLARLRDRPAHRGFCMGWGATGCCLTGCSAMCIRSSERRFTACC
jgi:Amino acid permease